MKRFLLHLALFGSLPLTVIAEEKAAETPEAILERADAVLAAGYPHAVLHSLHELAGDKSVPVELRREAGERIVRIELESGRPEAALVLLEELPDSPRLTFWRAQALLALGRTGEALPFFLTLIKEGESGLLQDESRIGAARCYMAKEAHEEAVALLESVPADSAFFHRSQLDLALVHFGMERPREALGILDSLGGDRPLPPAELAYLRARALHQLGAVSEALALLEVLDIPNSRLACQATVLRADCLVSLGQQAEAVDVLETFIGTSSANQSREAALAKLDRIYARQPTPSLSELRRWARDTSEPRRAALALYYLARAEARGGRNRQALENYQQFLEENPEHFLKADAVLGAGSLLLQEEQLAELIKLLDTVEPLPAFSFLRGKALEMLGLPEEAAEAFAHAAEEPSLKEKAIFNAAVCLALAGKPSEENPYRAELRELAPGGNLESEFALIDALEAARRRLPAAESKLRDLLPVMEARAAVPLAEFLLIQNNRGAAVEVLSEVPPDPEDDQAALLQIYLADDGEEGGAARSVSLARRFLGNFPESPLVEKVRMKLAELYFRQGDFLSAKTAFEEVAESTSDVQVASHAWLLAGRSTSKLMTPESLDQAMLAFEEAVAGGGELAARARFEQALLLSAREESGEALILLERVGELSEDPELRAAALMEKGNIFYASGAEQPKQFEKAIAFWEELAANQEFSRYWSEQARIKIGTAQEKLGNKDAALESYYSVLLDSPSEEGAGLWVDRAGFEAARILEDKEAWTEAIRIYDLLTERQGPRAEDARTRANRIRLENFIWED